MELKKLNIENYVSENGTSFNIELSYEVFGKPIGSAPIVLVNHALTGNSSVCGKHGWWNHIVGNNKLIDLNRYTVLAFNFPGNGYDGFLIRIGNGDQLGSGFVEVNPNSKIPALMDYSTEKPTRVFESGAILLYLAEKFNA